MPNRSMDSEEGAPDGLLEYGSRLGLNAAEIRLLICIHRFKSADTDPAIETIARTTGESVELIDKTLQRIVKRGLLIIEQEMDGLVYDFTPLTDALAQVEEEDSAGAA